MGITPLALASRPSLDDHLRVYYSAYNRISRSRDVSMAGALPLKISEIAAYCTLFKIDSMPERERLFDRITVLDDVYMDYVAKKQEANKPSGSAQKPP